VFRKPGHLNPAALRTWTTDVGDIRHDLTVADEVAAFARQHHARDTITPDRITGCPHQEGIDYPLGRTCPRCPFWAGIDRFTHEPLITPEPTMSPAEILSALLLAPDTPEPPLEALTSADGHRPLLVEPLLSALERGIANPSTSSEEESSLFCYALYLLARWRETRAYPYVVRWLSLPGEAAFDIAGDVVVQDGADILAAVCDGLEAIKTLVLDRGANEYCRGAGVTALARLALWAEVPREVIVNLFLWLAQEGLEREPGQVWSSLAYDSADIEAREVFPELRRAYADDLIDARYIHPSELDAIEAAPRGSRLEEMRDRNPPIDDVADATGWWPQFAAEGWSGAGEPVSDGERVETYRAPAKVGRNEPCPCGSGKKFKKCCGS
jgi:hypothetical protein